MLCEEVNKAFREKGITLGSVESLTGGLFAHEITRVSGASQFYKGGFITYATEEKIKIIKVPEDVINRFGVVSREVAYHMANNARQLLDVDYCVSFTGNAGPSKMENKPVGEVHIGIAAKDSAQVYSLQFSGTREQIQRQCVTFALNKILEIVKSVRK